jgi:N-acetylmuramoyl-L-alanine amidase
MSEHLTITADALNVRENAGTAHRVLVALPRGTRVQRLESGDGWFRIRTDAGVVGWISAKYAAEDSAPAAEPLRVTATSLNLRSGPGTAHARSRSS